MKYAVINDDGFPQSFYSEDVHGSRDDPNTLIPADAVEITDDQWRELLENQGRRKWQGGEVVEYEPPPPEPLPEPVPQIISRRQFYQGLAVAEFITKQEALDAIKGGALPTAIQSIVDALPDPDEKFAAEMLLLGTSEFQRSHPLVMVFAISEGMSEDDVDDFWRLCASL